jgi:hypothetical protein
MTTDTGTYIVSADESKRWRVDDAIASRSKLLEECVAAAQGDILLDFPSGIVETWLNGQVTPDLSLERILTTLEVSHWPFVISRETRPVLRLPLGFIQLQSPALTALEAQSRYKVEHQH